MKSGGRRRRWIRRAWRALALAVLLACVGTAVPIGLLRWFPPPTSAFMLRSRSADPATGRACPHVAYRWAPLRSISPHVPRAVVVAEDQRFLEHHGFDTKAIGDAFSEYASAGRMRGASTISQQVAKNLFLWPGRSALRKLVEAWLTLWIELLWPKHRILEMYVNIAQFGPCVFGVGAASDRYFGVEPADISARGASLLAAVLPAPGRMRVDAPAAFTEQRALEILTEMRRDGGPLYLRGL